MRKNEQIIDLEKDTNSKFLDIKLYSLVSLFNIALGYCIEKSEQIAESVIGSYVDGTNNPSNIFKMLEKSKAKQNKLLAKGLDDSVYWENLILETIQPQTVAA